jgi:hypothetical protein
MDWFHRFTHGAVAAGTYNTVALKRNGSVISWQAGDTTLSRIPAGLTNEVVAISVSGDTAVAVKRSGDLVAWSLGFQPVPLPGTTGFVAAIENSVHGLGLLGSPFTLRTEPFAGGVAMTWSTNASRVRLQSAPALNSDGLWNEVPGVPEIRGAQFILPVPANAAAEFFRLFQPE